MSAKKNMIGKKFGRLTVLKEVEQRNSRGLVCYLCKCDCGNEVIVCGRDMTRKHTFSCGCLQKDKVSTHNKSQTRLYKVWMDMRSRCNYENGIDYKRYGSRGIKVCDKWLNDFQAFYDWSFANGYDENAPRGECTLDRIDVNGNYCPENCRWATWKEQANNRTNNRIITYHGEKHTLAEWSGILGINYSTLAARLNKYGWSVEQAFSTESLPRGWNLQDGKARNANSERNPA